ncbi:uncharacterized protein LOC128257862 isoform X1 [Drosophila gunungcola]|uniref:Uncharacterized protein n=1 Tax=Drosophila gunungcola TaxID=103775 RepID=A0A9P9YQB3_9MUSC|nr:uncharacterized protein LOC128257862 isoform X1 [Drosophila gunungcola]KAI8041184.1 hypothetical protein M5D96_005438 [Drosophila gunungcola]
MPRSSKLKGKPPSNRGRHTPIIEILSDSDSEEDEEFIKHLFSDETLKKLESKDIKHRKNVEIPTEKPIKTKGKNKPKKGKHEERKKNTEVPISESHGNISNISMHSHSRSIETPKTRMAVRSDTPIPPHISCLYSTPILKPLPTKFCIGDVVLDFGLEENSEPMHVVADVEAMPPPNLSRIVKTRRLPTKYKVKQPPKKPKPAPNKNPPAIDTAWLMDHTFWPRSPIKSLLVNEVKTNLPSSEDIWKSYKALKDGLVQPSEAEWPLCCMGGQKSGAPKTTETPNSQESCSKNSKHAECSPAELLLTWEMNRKVGNDMQQQRNFHNEDLVLDHLNISVEEEKAMKDWIKSEGLDEPLCDIEEYDVLLSLASDYSKNKDVLFELLKPKSLVSKPVKDVKKKLPQLAIEVLPRKVDKVDKVESVVLPEKSVETENPAKKAQPEELRPERPIVLEVKDIGPVPPKPQDEAAIQDWLQQCSDTVSQQLQFIFYEDSSSQQEAIDFESEISKEQMKPRSQEKSSVPCSKESGYQNSYKVRLEDFEDIIDQNLTEFRDPQAKRLRSKWDQQFGVKSAENLRRSLLLPPLPVHLDKCLQKIRILRRPPKRKVEDLRLRIEMKFCKTFCTLQVNKNLELKVAVNSLSNAVYNSDIDVLQVQYEATQIAWIWSNGTVMIINGRSQAMLAETQKDVLAKITGLVDFKADSSHKLLHLRLMSCGYYPWRIALVEFSKTYALCSELLPDEVEYVYYVDKALPGVAARVHESGMIHVFAMTTDQADKMLTKLYPLTANHRKAEIKVVKNEKT